MLRAVINLLRKATVSIRCSVRVKLMLLVLAVVTLISVFMFIYFPSRQKMVFESSLVDKAQSISTIISNSVTPAVYFDDQEAAQEVINAATSINEIICLTIRDSEGEVFCSWNRPLVLFENSSVAEPSGCHAACVNAIKSTNSLIWDGDTIGTVCLSLTTERIDREVAENRSDIALAIILVFVLATMSVMWISSFITKPLSKTARVAHEIAGGNYSERAEVEGTDELSQMALSFNRMVDSLVAINKDMENLNQNLEERVNLRTEELQIEMTEHKRSKLQIAASLKEKETLLKEVHHRVKNNLQIITSLLNLQANELTASNPESILQDSMSRVKSMALIHERLYQSQNLAEIEFAEYVESLTRFLMSTISGNQGQVSIVNDVDGIVLPVDTAVPCGLIINELVTNALKYAFPGRPNGEIAISCRKSDGCHITLTVSDNGVGIPDNIDQKNTTSLGMRLVHSLIDQLDGTISIKSDAGTMCTIEFDCNIHHRKDEAHVPA